MNIILCKVLYKIKMCRKSPVARMTQFLWRILQLILFLGHVFGKVFKKVMIKNCGNPGEHICVYAVFLQNAVNI